MQDKNLRLFSDIYFLSFFFFFSFLKKKKKKRVCHEKWQKCFSHICVNQLIGVFLKGFYENEKPIMNQVLCMFSFCQKCNITVQCSRLVLILPSLLEGRRRFGLLVFYSTQFGLADIVLAELISPTHMVELYPGMQRLNKWKIPGSFTSQSGPAAQ